MIDFSLDATERLIRLFLERGCSFDVAKEKAGRTLFYLTASPEEIREFVRDE